MTCRPLFATTYPVWRLYSRGRFEMVTAAVSKIEVSRSVAGAASNICTCCRPPLSSFLHAKACLSRGGRFPFRWGKGSEKLLRTDRRPCKGGRLTLCGASSCLAARRRCSDSGLSVRGNSYWLVVIRILGNPLRHEEVLAHAAGFKKTAVAWPVNARDLPPGGSFTRR